MEIPKVKEPSHERKYMLEAIEEQKKCSTSTKVGAVAVVDDVVEARAHKTGNSLECHAEQLLLAKLSQKGIKLADCEIYVTMEPCSGEHSCSEKLAKAKVKKVVVGCYDLNSSHYRKGWTYLRNKRILLKDFDLDLRNKIKKTNKVSESNFKLKIGPTGSGKFSYDSNGNNQEFILQFSEEDLRTIVFRASHNSLNSVHIFCKDGAIAVAKGAVAFEDIDDPTALDLNVGSWATVDRNAIVVLCTPDGCALVKVGKINVEESSFKFKFAIVPALID